MKKKGLLLNESKCAVVPIGSKEQRAAILSEVRMEPIRCGKVLLKDKPVYEWRGQYMSEEGLTDSVHETIISRLNKIKGAGNEIINVSNNWRPRTVGGIETALYLWQSCCIPSLLSGAGTWVEALIKIMKI